MVSEKICGVLYYLIAAGSFWTLLLMQNSNQKGKQTFTIIGVGAVLIICLRWFLNVGLLGITLVEMIVSWLIVKEKWFSKILNLLTAYFAFGIVNDVVKICVKVTIGENGNRELFRLIEIIIAFVILLLFCRTKYFREILAYFNKVANTKKILCLLAMIVAMFMVSFGIVILEEVGKNGIVALFLILSVIFLLIISSLNIYIYRDTYKQNLLLIENEIKESVISEQKALYNLILEKEEETKLFRHDISNHLGVLRIMLDKSELKQAKEYLSGMLIENEKLNVRKIYYGHDIIDTVIAMMCWRAKGHGVDVMVSGRFFINDKYIYDLCCIFMNAIGNAIEACERQNAIGPVKVIAEDSSQMQVVSISNPATEEMYECIQKGQTSKKDSENHGLGIKNIKSAMKRMGAEGTYSYERGYISLIITIEK